VLAFATVGAPSMKTGESTKSSCSMKFVKKISSSKKAFHIER
jgi:hypothetical protein